MLEDIRACTTLNNNVKMPWLGFGTFRIAEGEEAYQSVRHALDAGYRSVDTASMYVESASVCSAATASAWRNLHHHKLRNEDQRGERVFRHSEPGATADGLRRPVPGALAGSREIRGHLGSDAGYLSNWKNARLG